MKKLFTLFALSGLANASAQTPCDDGRFASEVFENVTVTQFLLIFFKLIFDGY